MSIPMKETQHKQKTSQTKCSSNAVLLKRSAPQTQCPSNEVLLKQSAPFPSEHFLELSIELLQRGLCIRFQANGWSMRPTIADGEIITVAPVAPSNVKVGDIILYHKGRKPIAHRVVKIANRGSEAPLKRSESQAQHSSSAALLKRSTPQTRHSSSKAILKRSTP